MFVDLVTRWLNESFQFHFSLCNIISLQSLAMRHLSKLEFSINTKPITVGKIWVAKTNRFKLFLFIWHSPIDTNILSEWHGISRSKALQSVKMLIWMEMRSCNLFFRFFPEHGQDWLTYQSPWELNQVINSIPRASNFINVTCMLIMFVFN